MARKDEIFSSFLQHELLNDKYNLTKEELPNTIQDALNSNSTIIRTIAMIVYDKESPNSSTDKDLYKKINYYLNEAAI